MVNALRKADPGPRTHFAENSTRLLTLEPGLSWSREHLSSDQRICLTSIPRRSWPRHLWAKEVVDLHGQLGWL